MSASRFKKQIIRLSKKAKTSFKTKEVLVFLLFYILSTLLWFLYKTSQLQEVHLDVPIVYKGIPSNVEIDGSLPSHLVAVFKDKGSSLFFYLLGEKLPPVTIDVSNRFVASNEKIAVLTRYYEKEVSSHLRSSAGSLFLMPDTLVISYTKLYAKRLPVRFSGNIQLARQYILSDSLRMMPDEVAAFGPKKILDTMQAIYTKPISLLNVQDSTDVKCQLFIPPLVHVDPPMAVLHLCVEPFTEKILEIPIQGINMPQNLILRTFPATVKVVCLVGISHFNDLMAKDFKAIVDYNTLDTKTSRKATVTLTGPASFISNCHIVPESVDYLLEPKQ